jgi:hypothetical protein
MIIIITTRLALYFVSIRNDMAFDRTNIIVILLFRSIISLFGIFYLFSNDNGIYSSRKLYVNGDSNRSNINIRRIYENKLYITYHREDKNVGTNGGSVIGNRAK